MNEPRWLVGGDAILVIARDVPTVWLVSITEAMVRRRAEAVPISAAELAEAAPHEYAGERQLRRRLAKLMLAEASGCRPDAVCIRRNADGAPIVALPAGWHLSLAARWPDCAIGIAPYPLGVDIERIEGDALPSDLMTDAERRHSISAGAATGVTAARCWAAKEAHAKWTGRPLDLDPSVIETGFPPMVTSWFGITRCWARHAPDYVAAVCTA